MFSFDFRARALSEALRIAASARWRVGGVSSASHLPREHWLTVHRGPEVYLSSFRIIKVFMVAPKMTRRAGVSRRVIFRGQGEVGMKLKPSTDVRLAPFNLDLLQVFSYEFS